MREWAVAVALVGLSCAGEPAAASVDDSAPAEAAPAMTPLEAEPEPVPERDSPEDLALTRWLEGCAVDDGSFRRLKLYTWTTAERISELRSDRVLLAHGRMPGEMSRFDAEITDDRHPVAAHLRHARRGRRYAWIAPWATRMGWEDHDYGAHLVEITLREGAWFARFAPGADERWQVYDEEGQRVPEDEVPRNIGRIAAVYHVASGENAYREVIVVDERHVERWSFATPALRERLSRDAERLRALADRFEAPAPWIPEDFAGWLRAGWTESPAAGASWVERYRSCLALGSSRYVPTAAHLRAMAEAIEAVPAVEPLEHEVRRDRMWGTVLGTRIFCDETAACWEDWHRAGTLPLRAR